MTYTKLLSCLLLTLLYLSGTYAQESVFKSNDHCLAYRTPKKMFFFTKVVVIGKSCEVQARVEKKEQQVRFIVSVPVDSFDSDNSFRDGQVQEILKVEKHPEVRFESVWMTSLQIKNSLKSGKENLRGKLKLAGRTYPVSFTLNLTLVAGKLRIFGHLKTNYSALDIEPPVVGPGGFIANVQDNLELLVQLQNDQITGFQEAVESGP